MKVNKKGVSLIVLIITIIVLLILVAVIALNLKNNNSVSDAYEARFKSDITTFRDELTMFVSNEYGKSTTKLNLYNINATKTTSTYKNILMQEMIKSMDDKYADKLIVEEAELKFIGSDHEEIEWFNEIMNSAGLKDLKGIKQISSAGALNLVLMNDGTVRSWGGPPPVLGIGYVNSPQPWPQPVIAGEPELELLAYMDDIPGVWINPIQSDRIVIEFESNDYQNDLGFIISKIRYTLDGELIEEKLQTPIMHVNYDYDEYEDYEIYKPGATDISVNFSFFSVEDGWDYVSISDYYGNVTRYYTGEMYLDSMDLLESNFLSGVKQVSAGIMSNFALMEDGTVKTWGTNAQREEYGYYYEPFSVYPTTVSGLTNVKKVVSNAGMCLALMNDGTVKYWGMSMLEESMIPSPRTIYGLTGVKDISAGIFNFVFLMEDGTIRENGVNVIELSLAMDGEIPPPEIIPYNTTVAVEGLTNVKAISSSMASNLALMEDGTLKTWGYDMDFALKAENIIEEIGDIIYKCYESYYYEPSQVEIDAIISDLSDFGIVIDDGADIFDIVYVVLQQLAADPKTIENIDNVRDIATGAGHFATTYEDDTMEVHGLTVGYYLQDFLPNFYRNESKLNLEEDESLTYANNFMNKNKNMFNNRSNNIMFKSVVASRIYETPKINIFRDDVILENVNTIAAGWDSVLVLLKDGTLWSWGENYFGQIGDGSFTQSPYPIQIDPSVYHEFYVDNTPV
ncbi:MAG: hypothetical protein PHR25_07105 [Clostridia bacterium]|nr:hypothetical protein [Clostridia bacterium]